MTTIPQDEIALRQQYAQGIVSAGETIMGSNLQSITLIAHRWIQGSQDEASKRLGKLGKVDKIAKKARSAIDIWLSQLKVIELSQHTLKMWWLSQQDVTTEDLNSVVCFLQHPLMQRVNKVVLDKVKESMDLSYKDYKKLIKKAGDKHIYTVMIPETQIDVEKKDRLEKCAKKLFDVMPRLFTDSIIDTSDTSSKQSSLLQQGHHWSTLLIAQELSGDEINELDRLLSGRAYELLRKAVKEQPCQIIDELAGNILRLQIALFEKKMQKVYYN